MKPTLSRGGRREHGEERWSGDSPMVLVGATNSSTGTLARRVVCMTYDFAPKRINTIYFNSIEHFNIIMAFSRTFQGQTKQPRLNNLTE